MAWTAVAGAGVGLLGTMMAPKQQTQTNTKEPWGPAQGSMIDNLNRGKQLQDFYTANPFSNAQKTAYGNQFALSDQYRQMLPQLSAGLNHGQFNRANPAARAPQTQFGMNNLGMGSVNGAQPFATDQQAPTAAPARYVAPPEGPGAYKGGFWDPLSIDKDGWNKSILTGGLGGLF